MNLEIPFEPEILGVTVPVHLILEYMAFLVAWRYYVFLRRKEIDDISSPNRLSIILGAAIGAFLGSRLIGYLENPIPLVFHENLIQLLNTKTIMGGLFGGLLGVEIAKKIIGETQSSGDLFTLPIVVGIFIGRIGCFLSGMNEFTYGKPTHFITGMDLGDGLSRHPVSLYELVFLVGFYFFLKWELHSKKYPSGTVFKHFMIGYFSFRFLMEFLKPNVFLILGFSSIQILCLLCLVYYHKTVFSPFRNKKNAY